MLLLLLLLADLQQADKPRPVAIAPVASVVLPATVTAVMTGRFSDAWVGFIEPTDKSYRLNYGIGLVEKAVTAEHRKALLWIKTEGGLEYGVERTPEHLRFRAQVGWTGFVCDISDEPEIDRLLAIVRTVGGPCGQCEKAKDETSSRPAR